MLTYHKKTLAPFLMRASAKHAMDGQVLMYVFSTEEPELVDHGVQPIDRTGRLIWLSAINLNKRHGAVTFAAGAIQHCGPGGSGSITWPFESHIELTARRELPTITTYAFAKHINRSFSPNTFWWIRRLRYEDISSEVDWLGVNAKRRAYSQEIKKKNSVKVFSIAENKAVGPLFSVVPP